MFFLNKCFFSVKNRLIVLAQKGFLGKRIRIDACIGRGRHSEQVSADIIVSKRKKICDKYAGVRLWGNGCGKRIGEFISCYLLMAKKAESLTDGFLNVMVDIEGANGALVQILSRSFPVVTKDNAYEWNKILKGVKNIDFSHYEIGNRHRMADVFSFDWCKRFFYMTDSELEEGATRSKKMGLNEPFVCISARDKAFLNSLYPNIDTTYHNYRDSNFANRKLTIDYLASKGIQTVRMGKIVEKYYDFPNCIEYYRDYYDEFMDMYLFHKCKFAIGDSNGLLLVPLCNNGNVVFTNITPVVGGWGGSPVVLNGIYLFKKMYSKKMNRFLNLTEMVDMDFSCNFNGHKYAEHGIELIENSPEEILEAAKEMNERLDGTWTDTHESLERQKLFNEFRKDMMVKHNILEGDINWCRIGDHFLRSNWEIFGL